ncbi:hypothetical protein KCH_29070 [Kitasatospora cheerisanensis KCTC 2395]|uniref:Uncharacterized protein n=1 Tax=Kitasatospora cheerisanensis KCTC 2395 TaxID=1348663 RepID=A0A066Z4Q1_9ACTN|nr:hypothetical protein KCH_29070 [Kitasatospora cheerisanensis KCTC 2395]
MAESPRRGAAAGARGRPAALVEPAGPSVRGAGAASATISSLPHPRTRFDHCAWRLLTLA